MRPSAFLQVTPPVLGQVVTVGERRLGAEEVDAVGPVVHERLPGLAGRVDGVDHGPHVVGLAHLAVVGLGDVDAHVDAVVLLVGGRVVAHDAEVDVVHPVAAVLVERALVAVEALGGVDDAAARGARGCAVRQQELAGRALGADLDDLVGRPGRCGEADLRLALEGDDAPGGGGRRVGVGRDGAGGHVGGADRVGRGQVHADRLARGDGAGLVGVDPVVALGVRP